MRGRFGFVAGMLVMTVGLFGCAAHEPGGHGSKAPTASAPATGEQPVPDDLRQAVARSSEIGVQLYLLDKAAAIGTDVLLASVPDPGAAGVGGYLPFREADDAGHLMASFRVSFFTAEDPPRILYDVHVPLEGKPRLDHFDPPRQPEAGFVALVHSRQAAIEALPEVTQPINPVVLPAEVYGEHGTLVYLLAGTKRPNVAVFGKHYLALVPTGGSKVSYIKPLTKGVLEVPIERQPPGGKLDSLMVTHIVTEYPLETHVFTSLLHHVPLMVVTQRGLWRVEGEHISYLGKAK